MIDAEGNSIPCQLIPLTEADRNLREKYVNLHAGVNVSGRSTSAPKFFLVFAAAVPPLGYTSFVVRPASFKSKSKHPCLGRDPTRNSKYIAHLHSSLIWT